MEYFCFVNVKPTKARKELIHLMHPKIKKIIHGLEELDNLEAEDIVIFDNVLELDKTGENNVQAIKEKYLCLKNKGIEMMFDRTSSLDTNVMLPYEDNFDLDFLLEWKIMDYLTNRIALLVMKQYTQKKAKKDSTKSCGRPKGSKSESPKAMKVKAMIINESKDFNGTEADIILVEKSGVSRRTYYKYKSELRKQLQNKEI